MASCAYKEDEKNNSKSEESDLYKIIVSPNLIKNEFIVYSPNPKYPFIPFSNFPSIRIPPFLVFKI